jgi:cation diffusion facilitator family transporter
VAAGTSRPDPRAVSPGDDAQRDRRVRRVLVLEGATDVLLIAAKLAVAIPTGASAILADALHSATDLANNFVALVALRLAAAPPDREHPYGHRKFEPLAVFVLASLLVALGVQIALHALRREPHQVLEHQAGLAVMLGVLVANIGFTAWEWRQARLLDSDLLRADARHTLSDVAVTSSVIVGWQLAARGWPWLDPLVAICVAALILWLAYGLFRRAIPVLVDSTARDPDDLLRAVRGVPGVRDAPRVRSRHDGRTLRVDVAVTVDPELSARAAHEIADAIEERLRQRFGAEDVVVHVEPEER